MILHALLEISHISRAYRSEFQSPITCGFADVTGEIRERGREPSRLGCIKELDRPSIITKILCVTKMSFLRLGFVAALLLAAVCDARIWWRDRRELKPQLRR